MSLAKFELTILQLTFTHVYCEFYFYYDLFVFIKSVRNM